MDSSDTEVSKASLISSANVYLLLTAIVMIIFAGLVFRDYPVRTSLESKECKVKALNLGGSRYSIASETENETRLISTNNFDETLKKFYNDPKNIGLSFYDSYLTCGDTVLYLSYISIPKAGITIRPQAWRNNDKSAKTYAESLYERIDETVLATIYFLQRERGPNYKFTVAIDAGHESLIHCEIRKLSVRSGCRVYSITSKLKFYFHLPEKSYEANTSTMYYIWELVQTAKTALSAQIDEANTGEISTEECLSELR